MSVHPALDRRHHVNPDPSRIGHSRPRHVHLARRLDRPGRGVRILRVDDDALDAFGVHGVGGTVGALLTGVFASHYLNSAVAEDAQGLIHGGGKLMLAQVYATVLTFVYTLVVSYIILKVLDLTMGLRVSDEEEQMGLDLTQHGEAAYNS